MLLDDLFADDVPVELPTTQPDQEWFTPNPAIHLGARQVARELNCDEITSLRLTMFGKTPQDITNFLYPAPQHIAHPDATVAGMSDAARQLMEGIARGERIAIYADYDVDGQTSLAIIGTTLRTYGAQIVEGSATAATGFGLTRDFVDEAITAGAKWLITVDCGSTQTDPIRLAQQAGLRCIVIDHHEVALDNPTDFHLNPRLAAARALREVLDRMPEVGCRQRLQLITPYTAVLDRLTERSQTRLAEAFGERYDTLVATIRRGANPTNTGSMLTWKFAAACHATRHDRVPNSHYGRPLFLAGLGAIADLAPCDDLEVRAFVRVGSDTERQAAVFGNQAVIPPGIGLLADALGEEPSRPDCLVRTRALLNLPKRTTEIAVADIQRLLVSDEIATLLPLVARLMRQYERLSTIRRLEMDPEALRQVRAADEAGEETYCAYATLDNYQSYAGYTRMVANTLVKDTGRPALCFAHKGRDEWGQELYKFSGANGVVPGAKLGELISDERMQAACTVRGHDWLGNEADLVCLGGHVEVVSGVCTREQIPFVQAAVEAWAADLDAHRRWRPIEHKRPRVAKRRVTARWFSRLETEASLLAPMAFPENPAVQVSVVCTLDQVQYDPESESWIADARIDDLTRPVRLSDHIAELVRAFPNQRWEAVMALGRPGRYWIGCVACA